MTYFGPTLTLVMNVLDYTECASVFQAAGLSSPLHCDSGGAERCVSVPCPWTQEGKKKKHLTYSVCS